jgi:hypothetical protein
VSVVGLKLHTYRDVGVCSIGQDELTAVLCSASNAGTPRSRCRACGMDEDQEHAGVAGGLLLAQEPDEIPATAERAEYRRRANAGLDAPARKRPANRPEARRAKDPAASKHAEASRR